MAAQREQQSSLKTKQQASASARTQRPLCTPRSLRCQHPGTTNSSLPIDQGNYTSSELHTPGAMKNKCVRLRSCSEAIYKLQAGRGLHLHGYICSANWSASCFLLFLFSGAIPKCLSAAPEHQAAVCTECHPGAASSVLTNNGLYQPCCLTHQVGTGFPLLWNSA